MECNHIRTLLGPYLDGELDLVTSLSVEEHLRSCPTCALSYKNFRTLRAGLQEDVLYFSAPPTLPGRIRSSVRQSDTSRSRSFPLTAWRGWGIAAALVLVAALVSSHSRTRTLPAGDSLLAQEVVASHVRSLMGTHLADVVSSNQHTVKPWFGGKLDYSPPVNDLAAQGFPLIGGRLDYLDNRPVAALIYRRQKHLINLFVWPAKAAEDSNGISTQAVTHQGYHVLHWESADMTYWSVSDLNTTELSQFVRLVQAKDPSKPSPE